MSNATRTAAIASIAVMAATVGTAAIAAPAGRDLARSQGCGECHATDKEVWGPSYRQIAKYYRPLSDGQALMAQKVLEGGGEPHGDRSMPAHATRPVTVSEAQAEGIAAWILTVK